MEVSRAMEKIILQNAKESKTTNYPVQEPETFGCCFDSLNSALFSLSLPIFQLAPLYFLLSGNFTFIFGTILTFDIRVGTHSNIHPTVRN